jgi:hypothetical protein
MVNGQFGTETDPLQLIEGQRVKMGKLMVINLFI